MTAVEWVLVVFLLINTIGVILMIGKPRQPITPGVAVVNALIDLGIIFWVVLK